MVELKIKDLESLEAIGTALRKNGYSCTTFIHWGESGIDCYSIRFSATAVNVSISDQTANALEAIGRKAHGVR